MKPIAANICALALAVTVIILSVNVTGESRMRQAAAQKQRPPIRIQTDLVNILASVIDANGEPIVGLPQSAFQLFEENVEQKIVRFEPQTNRPLDLALLVDASGSATIELKVERDAAER